MSVQHLALVSHVLDQAFRDTADGYLRTDRAGTVLHANASAAAVAGLTEEQAVGRNLRALYPALPDVALQETLRICGREQAEVELHVALQGPAQATFVLRFLSAGDDVCVVFSRPSTEAVSGGTGMPALERGREGFVLQVLDSLFAFVGVLMPDGTLVQANRAPLEAAGITIEDVYGKKFWDCYWWSYDESVQQELRKACERAAHGEAVRYDVPVRRAGEMRMWIDFMISPLRDGAGRITHLIPTAVDITERKQAEAALRESEERFRAALRNAPVTFAHVDDELRYEWIFNPHPDFDPTTVIGKRDDELDDGPGIRSLVALKQRVLECGEQERQELTYTRTDGDRTYDITVTPVWDEDRQARRLITASVDVTERKRAEEALRESERRFRLVADTMPQLVWTARPDGAVDYYNQRYTLYQGISQDGDAEWMWQSVLHPDDQAATVAAWRKAVGAQTPYEVEHRVRMRDGSYRWHLSRAVPVHDEDGRIVRWYGTATDIHAIKEVEAALRESEERFAKAFHNGPVPIVIVRGTDGRYLDVNDSFVRLVGYEREELVGRTSAELGLIASGDWARQMETLEQTGRLKNVSNSVGTRNGEIRHVLSSTEVIHVDGEKHYLTVHHDVTDQKKAEQVLRELNHTLEQRVAERTAELEERNRELQNFAFVASHDLREPLRKVQAFGDLLQDEFGEQLGDEGSFLLSRMRSAAARMDTLLNDLLAFSRVATHKQPYAPVRLDEVVADVLRDYELAIREANAEVEVQAAVTIEADAAQLRQLMTNLIGNALKFRQAEVVPRIRIAAAVVEGEDVDGDPVCRITVEDNGIGFHEKYGDRIFEPFERLHGRSAYEGTGMGLALCRRIVRGHGGRITAESTPGEGSRFVVLLPARQMKDGSHAPVPKP